MERAGHLSSVDPFSGEDAGEVAVFFEKDHTLILLRGDIDLAVSEDLEHAGRDAIDADLPIVADARRVEMIDSVGVSFLIRVAAAARANGRSMSVRGPAPRVGELLAVAGASSLFAWLEAGPDDAPVAATS